MIIRQFVISTSILLFTIHSVFNKNQKSSFDEADSELTITVFPGEMECFYQRVRKDDAVEIEYQVTDANLGDVGLQRDLDINFFFFSPSSHELIGDYKKSDNTHRYEARETGDYKLCFDNRYSKFTKKMIYFEVYVDSLEDEYDWEEFAFSPELLYNDTMDQIRNSISKVHDDLTKVKHIQDQLKAIATRDRNIQEHNFTRVNHFSTLFIFVMIIVGIVQVIMVRSLFEENSRLHKFFQCL